MQTQVHTLAACAAQTKPIQLDGLQLLLTRETTKDPPQVLDGCAGTLLLEMILLLLCTC